MSNATAARTTGRQVRAAHRAALNAQALIAGARTEDEARDLAAEADRLTAEYKNLAAQL